MLKVCKILDVEPYQVFGYGKSKLFIDEAGRLIERFSAGTQMEQLSSDLSELIEHPEKIKKNIISFTDQERKDAQDLQRLFCAETIKRTDVLICYDDDGREALLDYNLFPSIKYGEVVKISQIIG